jgi:hypothetical protein
MDRNAEGGPATPATPAPGRAPGQRQLALDGWRSRLAVLVGGGLLFAGVSGLWIYLAPFSIGSQLVVVLHTLVGLAVMVPAGRYVVVHLRAWMRQKLTASMLLGYALLALSTMVLASGLVVTWESALGPRLGRLWDLTHLIAGIAVLALAVAHLLAAWLRRRPAARRDAELAAAMKGYGLRAGRWLGTTVAVATGVALLWPVPRLRSDPPAGYSLPDYAQKFDEYRGSPFAPTYARTDDLRLVAPQLLAGSASCGSAGCHAEVLAEWEPSAHRFAAMNPPFQRVQKEFAAERSAAETRYCAGCHDPISLFAGAKDIANQSLSAPGVDEGISCVGCHSISSVDQRGNADYVLTPPRRYLGEAAGGVAKWVSDFLIRAYPRQHLADYDRNLLRTPEVCGACHKQFIPEALNRFGVVQGQNQFDEWRNGHWHTDDADTDLSCRDCHMRLMPGSTDPGHGEGGDRFRSAGDESHRHHGFIATNNFLPAALRLPHWQEQVRLTDEWIRGETVLPEIAHLWPAGPVVGLELVAPTSARPGETVEVAAIVSNRKAGHNFTTGPLDFIRAWVHLRLRDGEGRLLAEWGGLDPATRRILDQPGKLHQSGNARDQGTLVLEGMPVDERGELLRRHQLWRSAGGKGKRVVFPAYSDAHRYRLVVPEKAIGPLTLEADLQYRRYRQEFLDLVVPALERDSGVLQPVVSQASARVTIAVGGRPAVAAQPHPGPPARRDSGSGASTGTGSRAGTGTGAGLPTTPPRNGH